MLYVYGSSFSVEVPCREGAFYDIGKFSLSYIIKSALRSDAHSHERQMSAKADHARRSKSVLLGREWNCEGVRSTLRRRGVMSLKRPAAGGESCKAGFFFIPRKIIKIRKHEILKEKMRK